MFHFHSQLHQHLRHRTGDRPYACRVCDRRFQLEHSHAKHMTTQSDPRSCRCTECKCLAHIDYLKARMRVYTGEKPYRCTCTATGASATRRVCATTWHCTASRLETMDGRCCALTAADRYQTRLYCAHTSTRTATAVSGGIAAVSVRQLQQALCTSGQSKRFY